MYGIDSKKTVDIDTHKAKSYEFIYYLLIFDFVFYHLYTLAWGLLLMHILMENKQFETIENRKFIKMKKDHIETKKTLA